MEDIRASPVVDSCHGFREELEAQAPRITRPQPYFLSQVPLGSEPWSVHTLRLRHCSLFDEDVHSIVANSNCGLRSLDLAGSSISDTALRGLFGLFQDSHFSPLPSWRTLNPYILLNRVHCGGTAPRHCDSLTLLDISHCPILDPIFLHHVFR